MMRGISVLALAISLAVVTGRGRSVTAQELSLIEAVALAREHSPLVRVAAGKVKETSAKTSQATAPFYPTLRLNSSYAGSDNPAQVFSYALSQRRFSLSSDLNNPAAADNWLLSAQAGLRLFSGGRNWANRRAARLAEESMQHAERATRDEATLQVTRAFLGVLTAQELLRASESAVDAYKSGEQVVNSRVSAGTALRTELLNIQVQKARAEASALRAATALALAKEDLRLAIGLDSLPYTSFGTLEDVGLALPLAEGGHERPEVKARASFVAAAQAELRAAKAGYFPTLDAFAGIDRFQSGESDGGQRSWSAGLTLTWPVFDGFLTRAAVEEKRARLREAEEEKRLVCLQTSVELKSASLNVRDASERVDVVTRAVALARESALLTRQRLAQGLAISSQVIDSENALAQTEAELAQAKADRLYAIAVLRRALGLSIIGDSES